MAPPDGDPVLELLTVAASGVARAPGRKPWDYGWFLEDYRRSADAALSSPDGPVTLTPDALSSWEEAVERLLREPQVQARWEHNEFWGLLGSLVVAASDQNFPRQFLARNLERVRSAGPAFTIQLVANVSWDRLPMVLGDVVIGQANDDLLNLVEQASNGRTCLAPDARAEWFEQQVQPRTEAQGVLPVAICCWTPGQQEKALTESERKLHDVVDLPLLLEQNLKAHKVYRRGEVNRPGVRGLTLDRGAIEAALHGRTASLELASLPTTVTEIIDTAQVVRWYSAEPLPIGQLLDQDYLREAVISSLAEDPVARSLRVAARWFAEAHYTSASDDAALALGVSMDALLSGKSALPGGAMADRFALLGPKPADRKSRRQQYLRLYGVRSAVAHGGRSTKLEREGFLDEFFESVRDAAWRMLALKDQFTPGSEDGLDELFDDLRLGVRTWPQLDDGEQEDGVH